MERGIFTMCGIVGYIGTSKALPVILDGLKRLEYRGYDSAGTAVLYNNTLEVMKKEGRLDIVNKLLDKDIHSYVGIGHTRWATHGKPSDINAHPHTDCKKEICVVHNGIIENYMDLRESLEKEGHLFVSQTDTEVIPHLIEKHYSHSIFEAVKKAVKELKGSFAMVVACKKDTDELIAVRKDSPLVIGLGEGENFIASDIPAILHKTRKMYILDDDEIAIVRRTGVDVYTNLGEKVEKSIFEPTWDPIMAEKSGYEHFMLKEINEEPTAIQATLSGRIKGGQRVNFEGFDLCEEEVRKIKKIFIVACGTASYAGLVGKYLIEEHARIPVEVDLGSEFRYRNPIIDKDMLTIIISQSGETADTLASLRLAKAKGSRILAITNVVGSTVDREADDIIHTWAGPEIAVASTKAFVTQLVVLNLLSIFLAQKLGTLKEGVIRTALKEIQQLPEKAQSILDNSWKIEELGKKYSNFEDVFFIGRGMDFALSLEGALKLKEISYVRAEAYAAGELKHGTLALIEEGVPVIALATQNSILDKLISNIKEVKARGADVIAVAPSSNGSVGKSCDRIIEIPQAIEQLMPILSVIPLQLFAYYVAKARGCDIDKPRNLAKSVTVE